MSKGILSRLWGPPQSKARANALILLSIGETCKNKGVRFLDFLLLQESDVDRFASQTRPVPANPPPTRIIC
jgi:hypothetical protein